MSAGLEVCEPIGGGPCDGCDGRDGCGSSSHQNRQGKLLSERESESWLLWKIFLLIRRVYAQLNMCELHRLTDCDVMELVGAWHSRPIL